MHHILTHLRPVHTAHCTRWHCLYVSEYTDVRCHRAARSVIVSASAFWSQASDRATVACDACVAACFTPRRSARVSCDVWCRMSHETPRRLEIKPYMYTTPCTCTTCTCTCDAL